ncbi:MAG: hypothetical protein KDB82_17915 [Planctomycetes bacterium]|nr:hypothetical protein [Planctomycetota bacterium]
MVEVRKSTWLLLGVMCLLIFAPLFFIDVDGLPGMDEGNLDNSIHPSVPNPGPSRPHKTNAPEDNRPTRTPPPENAPDKPEND